MEVFRRAAEVNPIRPDTYVNMGIIYEKWGKADSAYAEFARAAALGHEKAMEKIRRK
jgi:Flp pilus assembly protein TadD